MSRATTNQQGFSTVELLISLFIAAAFIGTGFQLFSVVTKDSNKARLRATAASIVNAAIQKHIGDVNDVCGTPPPTTTEPIATAELPQASTVITYSCPYGTGSRTTRIKAVVTYGPTAEKVEGSLDVTR